MKYTFIIPVYNGEKYIDRCLKSILNQTYKNFEVIIINDGSTDHSKKILTKYKKEYSEIITLINQENKGLSLSRNIGIMKASGEYILFVDIDDYISKEMLSFLEEQLKKVKYDLIKFEWTNKSEELNLDLNTNKEFTGSEAISYLITKKRVFEMAVLYAYNKKFLSKTNFLFKPNRYHEDFGLIPITILKSNKVLLTSKKLYYYDQEVLGSITSNNDYDKELKKAYDVLDFYKELKEEILTLKKVSNEATELLLSYNANAVLSKRKTLNKRDRKEFDKEIIQQKILNDLCSKTMKTKIKKTIFKIIIKG